ncbi:alpha/beta hydrolase [Pyruvatibacter sp.]|uniref:alpha/beta hydrolase n=1 Tax=Pyruvatibacter sp. TaxID=1981328 RepID=UPI003264BE8A
MSHIKNWRIARLVVIFPLVVWLGACSMQSEELPPTYREIEGMWTDRWILAGADGAKLEAVLSDMKVAPGERFEPEQYDTLIEFGPGHWTYEFIKLGDAEFQRAEQAERAGNRDLARETFLEASVYYYIGKIPYTRDDHYPHYSRAYDKSMAAYERAGALRDVPLEVVELPFGDGIIRGYAHFAPDTANGPAPLIIGSGGIDTFKVEHIVLAKALNDAGISVLMADLPGVGESNYMASVPEHDEVFSGFLDIMSTHPRVDADRVGIYAQSWGGNAAAKIAFVDERFKAIASVCGPVHEALSPPGWVVSLMPSLVVDAIPVMRRNVLADRLGLTSPMQDSDMAAIAGKARQFSLVEQGFIGGDRKANTPILIINTDTDPVAPPADMELLASAAHDATVVYTDSFGHCGSLTAILDVTVPWLEEHLNERG